ncbi:autotransporter-associated beta strand repeat-containing protein [uncultured Roseibium sp.]|uniref:autotransporter-associated beta strand repeat-containing protein n=1 Tax=uncultured Roseibium sp. TaxID=1936171 RepID=UPI0026288480|nr:autotransporter-associated beta strand repeat-containing protein [uncultured Roseibium sp.]
MWLLNSHLLASTSLVAAGIITFAATDVQAQQIDIADGQTTTINTLTPFDDINFAGDGRLDGTGQLEANGSPTTIDVTGSGSAFIDSNIGRNGGNGVTIVNGDGGTGTLTVTGKISGTGVVVNAGTLILNNDDGDAIGDTDGLRVGAVATISLQTDETVGRLSGDGAFVLNANTLTFAGLGGRFNGVMSGTGGVVINAGVLNQIAGENTYTGSTTVNGGTLTIGEISPPPGEGVILDSNAVLVNGGELVLEVSETIGSLAGTGGTVTFEDNLRLTTGGNNASTTFGGSFGGDGFVNKRGTGTFTLSGDNTEFDGTVTVEEGTLSLATTAAGGDGSFSITTTGSVIDYADGVTSAAPIDINSNTTQLQVLTGSATQSGVISETGGARPMEKIGDGTLTLTGANTYTGGTTVTAGTLQLGNGGTTGSVAGDITNNAALIFNRSDAVTLSDVISGSGTVTKAGAGTLTLTGTNTYTGGTMVTAGTLQLGNGGTTGSVAGDIINNAALIFNRSDAVTLSGVVSGSGTVTKTDTGTLTLTGTNTYTGGTTVTSGTLQLGDGGTTGSVAGDITNNAALIFNRSDAVTLSGVISGSGAVTKTGTGTLTLTGTNTYTGGTTVTSGTLQLGNGGTTGSVAGDITNNAALIFNRSDAVTLSDVISGSGTVTKAGSGTLTLTGTNTYTGGTTVTSGTLVNQGTIAGAVVNNASFTNQAGATTGAVTSAGTGSNAGTIASLINTGGTFTNTGTIAAGASNSDGTTNNTGAIGGALVVSGGVFNQNAGGTLVGNTTVSSGQLNVNGTGTLSSASVTVDGGTLSTDGGAFLATADLQVNSGTFQLEGDETINKLINAGTVAIGAGNTLSAAVITNSSGTIRVRENATLQGTGNTLNNSSLIDVAMNGTVSDAGAINNLANGVINFNGPGGTATFASTTTGSIFNDGTINVVDGDVLVTGNLTNQGSGQLDVAGGDMTGIGVLTNTSTATSGVSVGEGRLLSADTIVNSTGAMLSNAGTLTAASGLTNATGATLTTTGTLNGAVTNRGTLNATGTINGAFTNGGVISIGGSGAIAAVTINGNLVQTADGSLVVDVDGASSTNDRVTVTGTADLAGTVDLNLTGADPVGLFTIVSAGGGVTDSGLALGTMQTFTNPLTEVQLVYPNANDVALNFSFNAEAGTFNSNQTNTLTTLNAINSGDTGETGPIIQGLFNLGSVEQMRTALNQLSPEIALNTETASLFSAANFTNSLFSCPVEGGAHAFIREGDCLWLRPQGRLLSVDETAERIGFEERVAGISVGGQYQVWTDWYAGFGLGYEQGTLDSNASASARSDRFHLGGTLKYQHGALLIAGAVSGGIGAYETTRSVNFGGLGAVNKGDYDISYAGAQMRAAYLLEEGGFYAKPQVDLYLAYLDRDGFAETGNSATALSVVSSEATYFSVTPAIEIGSEHALPNGWTARMRLKAGVTLSSQDQNSLNAHFAGAPAGAPGFESTSDVDNVLADVEAGVTLLSAGNTSLEFGYQGRLSPGTRQHGGFIKASLKF